MFVLRSLYSFVTYPFYSRNVVNRLGGETKRKSISIPIEKLQTKIYKPTYKGQCKPLKESKNTSLGEKKCKEVLEKIYKKPFYRVRPNFLRYEPTGRNLEIDCFNAELGIGCEYHGKQHFCYFYSEHPRRKREDFEKSLERDIFKMKACKKAGVYLIVVPYNIELSQIEEYIKSRLPR